MPKICKIRQFDLKCFQRGLTSRSRVLVVGCWEEERKEEEEKEEGENLKIAQRVARKYPGVTQG